MAKIKIIQMQKTIDVYEADMITLRVPFKNLLPGTIHETVEGMKPYVPTPELKRDNPEQYKLFASWTWVMGANGLPVRLEAGEFEVIE